MVPSGPTQFVLSFILENNFYPIFWLREKDKKIISHLINLHLGKDKAIKDFVDEFNSEKIQVTIV